MITSTNQRDISAFRTVASFLTGRACPDTLFNVLNHAFGQPMETEERAAMPLAGGIMQHGFQCGMIWGAALAAGARAHQLLGPGDRAEIRAVAAAQRLVSAFRARQNTINCMDMTPIDRSSSTWQMLVYFLAKGGSVQCFRMAAGFAPAAYCEINAAMAEDDEPVRCSPASCAAVMARRLGATRRHAVIAAGLAGGIGLSGGACGALGTAIWISGLKRMAMGDRRIDYKDPGGLDIVRQFLQSTDYAFECREIVGRRFHNIRDHSDHLRQGGCADIIEALAARSTAW